MTFEFDLAVFAKHLREQGAQIAWIGSPTAAAATSLKLAGPALNGSYAVADFNRDASMAAKEFAAKYEAAYKSAPDFFASWTYDAVHVLALAISNAQSLDAQRIREGS
jgi:branched-chain amino acid transport system substrate-binding protein